MDISSDIAASIALSAQIASKEAVRPDVQQSQLIPSRENNRPETVPPVVRRGTQDNLQTRLNDYSAQQNRGAARGFAGRFEEAYNGVERSEKKEELHQMLGVDEFA